MKNGGSAIKAKNGHRAARDSSTSADRQAREKISRVFRYLEALNQHRNPVARQLSGQLWSLWLHELPCHSSIQRGIARSDSAALAQQEVAALSSGGNGGDNFVFKVQRPSLSSPPPPPKEIAGWLKDGWDDPAEEATLVEGRAKGGRESTSEPESFSDNPARLTAFERWKEQRDEWAKCERPARVSMKIFEQLYELHGRLEREAERVELILGDGILSWKRPEGNIYHPVLLQRLQLEFNPGVPEFVLSEADYPVELYSALFQSLAGIDGRAIGGFREELEQGGYHPLDKVPTSRFLKRLAARLSPRGEFAENGAPKPGESEASIGRDAVVFLRHRTLGFAAAIEGVLEDLRTRRDLPWALLNIVGEAAPIFADEEPDGEPSGSPHRLCAAEAEVLLSKPANPEQIRIARQLEKHGGVLVQGPPGTGKTHTIGNLIGHLLAQGKSVLVTSHTTKALRMVRHHIVPGLRPLCVSVLESDLDSRRQLESAVAAIAERLGSSEAPSLEREARALEFERRDLLESLDGVLRQLGEARGDEYRDIVVDNKGWAPVEAARKVTQEHVEHGWIPSPIAAQSPLPLSHEELSELYRTNASVSAEDEHELSGDLPDPDWLPTPEQFEATVRERNQLRLEDLDFRSDLWEPGPARGSEQQLDTLAAKLIQAVEPLSGREKWKLAAVYAGKYGGVHRQPWDQLVAFTEFVHRMAGDAQEDLMRLGPVLPDDIKLENCGQIADEILEHLELGGKLGPLVFWKHKAWRQFVAGARINGSQPRRAEHFEALNKLARLKILRRDLGLRWDRQVAPLGAPLTSQMGDSVENTLIQFCGAIQDCLEWRQRVWEPLEQELEGLGFCWDKFIAEQPVNVGAYGELSRIERAVAIALLTILNTRLHKLRWLRLNHQLQELKTHLELARRNFSSSEVTAQLADAANRLDSSSYGPAHMRLVDLRNRQADRDLRQALLERLEAVAPAWAAYIRNRGGVHGASELPGEPDRAWVWRQLNDELERRAGRSMEALQSQSEKLREKLRRVTMDLIDRRAWAFQARRTSPHQRQALIGWVDTIRRIGKGTGLRVPILRAEAARKMSECRGAVPVWVMPLSRVVENFDPRVTRFDVVIVDEASQSDVMALLALYLGKTVLVVGDHEQVSPTPVGQDLGTVGNLISQYLSGIPNSHLYDGQISIYDLARQSFGGTTCLVEHFRCVPEIIQFSNVVSYDSRVKPLRDASRVQIRPAVVCYRVDGSSRDEKLNRQEALAVTSLIAAATEQPEYQINDAGRPVSFGVVSLVGDEQAILIDSLLRKRLTPDRYELHRLLCGNAAQFQGDERDVIFISVVDTAEQGPLRLRDQQLFKQRFNVAASRARDQMWVVHSLHPQDDLKDGDLRRQLIEHAYDPGHLMRALEEGDDRKSQSPFERETMKCLEDRGFQVTPQWRVGKYRIDLVVEGNGNRLAIECEGDPSDPMDVGRLAEDLERQAILERLGWTFARVRATEFFRDSDRALQPVFEKLQALGITPELENPEHPEPDGKLLPGETNGVGGPLLLTGSDLTQAERNSDDLVARVIRRADELRQEWIAA